MKVSPQAQSLLPELPSWARDVPSVTPSPCRNSGENGGPTYAIVKSDGAVTTERCTQLLSGATVLSRDQEEALQCGSWGRKDWVFMPGLLPRCSLHDVGQAISNGFQFSFLMAKCRCWCVSLLGGQDPGVYSGGLVGEAVATQLCRPPGTALWPSLGAFCWSALCLIWG